MAVSSGNGGSLHLQKFRDSLVTFGGEAGYRHMRLETESMTSWF